VYNQIIKVGNIKNNPMSKQIKFITNGLPVHYCELCDRPIRTMDMVRADGKFYHPGEFNVRFKKVSTNNGKKIKITKKESNRWLKFLLGAGIIYALTLILLAGQIKI
jgi:hypothetical protein